MNNNNEKFLAAYNRLDNYLQSLVKTSGHVNMISYLERISPEKKRSEFKTIRQYKNDIISHGVNPGGKKPIVPNEWVVWLLNELQWCKNNYKNIAPKLQKALDDAHKGSKKTNTSILKKSDRSGNSYTEYYKKMYGYETAKPEKKSTSYRNDGYTFVSAPPKTGFFSKVPDNYGWVICNQNGDFLVETSLLRWSSVFRDAIVFRTEREAKKTAGWFRDRYRQYEHTLPFFRIRCVKIN